MSVSPHRFWEERSVPGSPSWPFFRGRAVVRYQFAFPFARGGRVLDVASGTGHGAHLLATEGGAREVVGVDVSPEAVAYASEHYSDPHLRFLHGDSHTLATLNLGQFDCVTSMGTLEHIEQPRRFAAEVRDLLKPGGVWLVTMLNPAVQTKKDPYHFQEWPAGQFRTFLESFFHVEDLRWLILRDSGVHKNEKNRQRFALFPGWLKNGVKAILGSGASWKVVNAGARFPEPEDYEWSRVDHAGALDFLAVCRKSDA